MYRTVCCVNRLEKNVTSVNRSHYKLSLEYFILILILEYFIRRGGAGDHLPLF